MASYLEEIQKRAAPQGPTVPPPVAAPQGNDYLKSLQQRTKAPTALAPALNTELGETEALLFAAGMGLKDTYRGVKQLVGLDLQDMEADDAKLKSIFANKEYGKKAQAAWVGGMVLDPAGWLIPLGKVRTAGKLALYGAGAAGLSGLLGYVDEKDDQWKQRLINAGIGAGAGAVLVPAVSKGLEGLTSMATKIKGGSTPLAGVAPGRASDAPLDLVEPIGDLSTIIQQVPQRRTLMQPVKQVYQSVVGEPLKKFVFTNGGSLAFAAIGTTALNGILDDTEIDETGRTVALLSGFAALATTGKLTSKTTLGQWTARQFIDNYGLPAEAVALRRAAGRQANNMAGSMLEIVEQANKLDPLEQASFYKALEGRGVATTPEMQTLVDSSRNWLKDAGQQMVDLGILDKDVYLKNVDTYINRSYTEHLNKAREQKGLGERFVRKMRMIGTELRPRGVVKEVAESRQQHYIDQGFEVWGKGNQKGTIKVRRQLTDTERAALGEIENGSFALARTSRLMINDISRAKYYNSMADNFGVSLPKEFGDANSYIEAMGPDALDLLGKGYAPIKEMIKKGEKLVKLEGSKVKGTDLNQYGNLEGKWVPESIYRDLKATEAYTNFKNHPFFKPYREIQQYWKIGKTAWNPAVHMNNVMSNIAMFDFAEGSYKDLGWSFAEMLKGPEKSPYVREAIKNGVFDADLFSQELNKQNRELLRDYLLFKGDTESDLLQNMTKMIKKMEGGQKGWLPAQLYQWEDKVFRLALYKGRIERGFDPQTAVNEARKWFIDYDINAPMVNYLRETVTPFLAYSYRVIPLLTEAAIMRPWKFAKWAALGYGLSYMGEDVSETDTAKERRMMARWQQKDVFGVSIMPPTMLKMPLTVDGVPQYLNIERWVPGGDVFESKSSDNPLPAFMAPSGVGMALISGLLGYDSFRGEKIKGLLDDQTINNIKVKGEYLANQLLPNLPVPFGLTTPASKKLEDSIKGVNSPWAEPLPVWQAVLQLSGIKLTPFDLAKAIPRNTVEYMGKVNEIRKNVAEGSAKDLAYGRITLEDHQANMRRAVEMIQKLTRDFQEKQTGTRPPTPPKGKPQGYAEGGIVGDVVEGARDIKNRVIPLNIRTLVSHIMGDNTPINETHLVPEDLQKLKEVTIRKLMKGDTKLTMDDWGGEPGAPGNYGSGLPLFELVKRSYNDPTTRLSSTLGNATIKKNDKGETIIYDIYNFANADRAKRKQEMREEGFLKKIGERTREYGPYGLVSSTVNAISNVDDDSKGAPVEINLGVLNIPKPKAKWRAKGYAEGGEVAPEGMMANPIDGPRWIPIPKEPTGQKKRIEGFLKTPDDADKRPDLVPLRRNEKGELEWAMPNMVREGLQSLYNVVEGTEKGYITPKDALVLGGTSGVASRVGPRGTLGMFAGRNALTADKDKLSKAYWNADRRMSKEEARQETGWHQDKAGNWMFEIDDSPGELLLPKIFEDFGVDNLDEFPNMKLSDILDHQELFKAYPELKDIKIREVPEGSKDLGSWNKWNNTISLNTQRFEEGDAQMDYLYGTLLHEVQHAIQNREGWPTGGNPEVAKTMMQSPKTLQKKMELRDYFDRFINEKPQEPEFKENLQKYKEFFPWSKNDRQLNYEVISNLTAFLSNRPDKGGEKFIAMVKDDPMYKEAVKNAALTASIMNLDLSAWHVYSTLMGETQARTTEARALLTGADRQFRNPELDMDVPVDKQIEKFKTGGFVKKKSKRRTPK